MTAKSISGRQRGQIILRYGSVQGYEIEKRLRRWAKLHPEHKTKLRRGRIYTLIYSSRSKSGCHAISQFLLRNHYCFVYKNCYRDDPYRVFVTQEIKEG